MVIINTYTRLPNSIVFVSQHISGSALQMQSKPSITLHMLSYSAEARFSILDTTLQANILLPAPHQVKDICLLLIDSKCK